MLLIKVMILAMPHSIRGLGNPNPKKEDGRVATSLGNVRCMPMALNIGRNNLMIIRLLSLFVIAYEGKPYLKDAHKTPKNPFHATLLERSEVRNFWIESLCF